ncbi:undecaprenyldiphospho-muramoylpentapeptide beta-N-acetylglucosaminyltransferase [Pontiella agarivorans]|uniref:UDP-N-acetylglucosamine--N-acetylmuramyl-(pentapeptide) pyrophosphoryl-undecaprenol N-acetylglucosamine transferase n=1 Tax=Pontiella agarivorans TaxID=3038953 RepID=A0ABU5MT65_9BACT|nr:undecaprenyldiphospho-muramoylpentapeptide beta-N-acetylglucosaminyltransferase [Pontiella agarivorans]MDZ8117389.1 undecaprenyldiphospho-muramoylpentapeptide beta-N-acetylglucosaminyltransferase [Pontiella agarivorans]
MGRKLKIGVACGGTGGHIFPGLATANELASRGHEVTLWLAGKDIEHESVKGWNGEIITIPAEGFQFGFSFRSVQTVYRLLKAYRLALSKMKANPPDVVLAMGSYASFGPIKAAGKLNIPYVLHEANLLPGRAVSMLAGKADTIAVSFEKTSYYLKHANIVRTGMPLRKDIQDASARPRIPRAEGGPMRIMIMGGSRGAQVLNEVLPRSLALVAETGVQLEVIHIAGLQDTESIAAVYEKACIKAEVQHFIQHMEEVYLNTDLAICRSGAATCAELAAFGVPALLIPYPHAVRDHQMGNARILQDSGAADVVDQQDISTTWLRDYLIRVSEKPGRLERMATAMKKRGQSDAAQQLANLIEKVGGE